MQSANSFWTLTLLNQGAHYCVPSLLQSKNLRKADFHKTSVMNDLKAAKQRLTQKKLSLAIIKNSKSIFETHTVGLGGFLQAIKELNGSLSGSSVADKIVGRAVAFLCAYSNVKGIYAHTLSENGLEILNSYGIHTEFEHLVPTILNLMKTNKCPFEGLVEDVTDPQDAYLRIHHFATQKGC